AELINFANLEVQPHTVTGKRRPRPRQVQRDRAVASRGPQPRIEGYAFVAKFVHEFESQQVAIKPERASHVCSIDHCMVEGQLLAAGLRCRLCRRNFCCWTPGVLRLSWR